MTDEHTGDELRPHEHALREAATTALYVAIVLLALLAGFGGDGDWIDEVALIWGTAIGLGVAHLFAYRLTAIMAAGGRPKSEDYWAALGMAGAIAAIAALATLPYLVWDDTSDASTGSSILLMAVIGVAGFASARRAGATTVRALLIRGSSWSLLRSLWW